MAQQKNEVQSLLEKAMFQATVADFWMAGLELGVIKTNQRDEANALFGTNNAAVSHHGNLHGGQTREQDE